MSRLRRALVAAAAAVARPWVLALAVLLVLTLTMNAWARPGGGQSYGGPSGSPGSSGSGSGSSGGGGVGDDIAAGVIWLLFWLITEHPAVGLPILGIVVLVLCWSAVQDAWNKSSWSSKSRFRNEMSAWSAKLDAEAARLASGQVELAPPKTALQRQPELTPRQRLERLRNTDPEFSLVLFEDFTQALFHEVHTRRGGRKLGRFAAYVGLQAREALGRLQADEVRDIVVGSMRVARVRSEGTRVEVDLRIEANYTEVLQGVEHSYYVSEVWRLEREQMARSRPPEKSRVFGCPSCGAPLEQVQETTCRFCKQVVDTGEFDWVVSSWQSTQREERAPMLTGTTQELGTDAPTIVAPDARERWTALVGRDPALGWEAFVARVGLVFGAFHAAWSAQDLARMRPFLSDSLLQTQRYWIETYQREKLRNITERASILTVHLARVVSDRWFDALTVRVFATCVDYTVDARDRVVGGSKNDVRHYSEYWTFIRGSSRSGAPRATPECPSCGAPLSIEMSGQCRHCKALVTSGEFDWVLSRIEQDEAYGG